MWALGVVLYTMLYGQFPFYDSIPHELFRKIKTAEFLLPKYVMHLKAIFMSYHLMNTGSPSCSKDGRGGFSGEGVNLFHMGGGLGQTF